MSQGIAYINRGFPGRDAGKKLDWEYGPEFPGSQSKTISYKIESIHGKESIVVFQMKQCPSCIQALTFSCDSSNRLHWFSGQYPQQHAMINIIEGFTHQFLTSSIKESQQQGRKSTLWEVNTIGYKLVAPEVWLDGILLFAWAQPLEQHTPDEFHKVGCGVRGRWKGPVWAVGSSFFISHVPPCAGGKIHPSLTANTGANDLPRLAWWLKQSQALQGTRKTPCVRILFSFSGNVLSFF